MQMSRIKVSERLMKEIRLTANLVSEIVGNGIECEGLILSDYGNDYAKFSHIPEQDASYASCSSYGLEKIFNESCKRNQRVLGVWHSHGSFDVFHSSLDDNHLKSSIIPMAGKYNLKLAEKPHYPSKDSLEGVLLSIVVNSKGEEYYAEEFYVKDGRQVRLSLEEDSERVDEEDLVRSIGKNVRHSGLLLSQHHNYENVLKRYEGKLRNELNSSRLQRIAQTPNLDSILKIVTGKSSWKWEDRTREFSLEYVRLRNAQNIHAYVPKIEDAIDSNSYLIRNHNKIYLEMKYRLSELKYRSWFKGVRKQRYLAKKQRLKGHSLEPGAALPRQTQS